MLADLHIHTMYSYDSLIDPRSLVKFALMKGLSIIAVTDHNTLKGAYLTLRVNREFNNELFIIPGIEVRTEVGDVLLLFILEEPPRRLNLYELFDFARDVDAIVVLPHPFRRHYNLNLKMIFRFDAIEVLNGRCSRRANLSARRLAEMLCKPKTAGSDAHTLFEVGRAGVIFPDISDVEDVRRYILNDKLVVWGGDVVFPYKLISFGYSIFNKLIHGIRKHV